MIVGRESTDVMTVRGNSHDRRAVEYPCACAGGCRWVRHAGNTVLLIVRVGTWAHLRLCLVDFSACIRFLAGFLCGPTCIAWYLRLVKILWTLPLGGIPFDKTRGVIQRSLDVSELRGKLVYSHASRLVKVQSVLRETHTKEHSLPFRLSIKSSSET